MASAAGTGAGAPFLAGSRGAPRTGRQQGPARLVVSLLVAAVVLLIILAVAGVL